MSRVHASRLRVHARASGNARASGSDAADTSIGVIGGVAAVIMVIVLLAGASPAR